MKCPIDQTEMKKGMMDKDSQSWLPIANPMVGMVNKLFGGIGPSMANAYKCPKCGKVELSTN